MLTLEHCLENGARQKRRVLSMLCLLRGTWKPGIMLSRLFSLVFKIQCPFLSIGWQNWDAFRVHVKHNTDPCEVPFKYPVVNGSFARDGGGSLNFYHEQGTHFISHALRGTCKCESVGVPGPVWPHHTICKVCEQSIK